MDDFNIKEVKIEWSPTGALNDEDVRSLSQVTDVFPFYSTIKLENVENDENVTEDSKYPQLHIKEVFPFHSSTKKENVENYDDIIEDGEYPQLDIKEEVLALHSSVEIEDVKCDKVTMEDNKSGQQCTSTYSQKSILSFSNEFKINQIKSELINTQIQSSNDCLTILPHVQKEKSICFSVFQPENDDQNASNKYNESVRDENMFEVICEQDLTVSLMRLRPCNDCASGNPLKNRSSISNTNLEESLYNCPLCSCTYISSELFYRHLNMHTGNRSQKCNSCNSIFSNPKTLLDHRRTQHPHEKPYQCAQCSFTTNYEACLKKHNFQTHLRGKPYQCPHCSYTSNSVSNLKKHHREIHLIKNPYRCPHCAFSCVFLRTLQKHLDIHFGGNFFQCTLCSYTTKIKHYLKRHLKIHSREKPHQCPHCTFASATKPKLREHILIHTGEKRFQCPHCSFANNNKRSLRLHIWKHTGEKPYKCPHCSYATRKTIYLKKHIQTHSEEKFHQFTHDEEQT